MYVAGDPTKPVPEQSKQAFAALEAGLISSKGRRFFGVLAGNGYRACSSTIDTDDSSNLPHPTWMIPGGKYVRVRIPDWKEHTDEIGAAFDELYSLPNVDPTRPAVEYYRSQHDLFIMVPIR
jgi:hypothetical protein